MAALESVFSIEDLKIFTALPRSEKIVQLNELMEITSGVRLFNRDCKKGGEGIPDCKYIIVLISNLQLRGQSWRRGTSV